MDSVVESFLKSIEFGGVKTFENMSVIPLFLPDDSKIQFLTLGKALEMGILAITEIDKGGSVPQLKVQNKGDLPVFILDGEELKGAKQNRILNTSVLIPEHTEVIIPVSCTEHGRWSYNSRQFADSDVILSSNIKRNKMASVSDSLRRDRGFVSDQAKIWDDIHMEAFIADVHSPTGAMRDTYETRRSTLDEFLNAFPVEAQQKGLMVFINGILAGMEVLSLEHAYRELYKKIIRSYAMEASLTEKRAFKVPEISQAQNFIDVLLKSEETKHKSPGYGTDHRISSNSMIGSALVHDGVVIHAAFFPLEHPENQSERAEYIASLRDRIRFHSRDVII